VKWPPACGISWECAEEFQSCQLRGEFCAGGCESPLSETVAWERQLTLQAGEDLVCSNL
jgi:hypothetical protein